MLLKINPTAGTSSLRADCDHVEISGRLHDMFGDLLVNNTSVISNLTHLIYFILK